MIVDHDPPDAPAVNSRMMLEIVDDVLEVTVEWAPGGSVEIFGKILTLLCQGGLVDPILSAASMYGEKVDEKDKSDAIREAIVAGVAAARGDLAGRKQGDDPVICPTQMVKYNMGSFKGG